MDTRTLRQVLRDIPQNWTKVGLAESLFRAYAENKFKGLIEPLLDQDPLTWDLNSAKNIQYFLHELAEYYELHPALGYNFSPHTYLNQACLAVATFLQIILGVNRYQLLMPKLKVLTSAITTTNLIEDDLPLHQFIQTRDRFIEIEPCLDFAREDAILKHTTLIHGQVVELNSEEKELVIEHSSLSNRYWGAIKDKFDYEMQGNSFGAALNRLADGLKEGGVYAGGKRDGSRELDAANDANVAIYFFSQWLESLTEQEKEQLMTYNADRMGMAEIWGRLARPKESKYVDTIYCVDVLSERIQDILHYNPQLFDVYPAAELNGRSYQLFENGRDLKEKRLISAKNNFHEWFIGNDYRPNYSLTLSDESYEKFVIKLFKQTDLESHLLLQFKKIIACSDSYYESNRMVELLLRNGADVAVKQAFLRDNKPLSTLSFFSPRQSGRKRRIDEVDTPEQSQAKHARIEPN